MNLYEQFLNYIRNKSYPEGTLKEFHHEPPHHTGLSSDDSPLNVYASVRDHVLLHQYRWVSYGEKGDYLMFKGRQNDTQEFRRVMNDSRIESCKERRSGFWDPVLQTSLGKRGGKKGGSANTENQFKSRQRVGLCNRKSLGLKRDYPTSKATLSNWTLWENETTGLHLLPPQPTIRSLSEALTRLGVREVNRSVSEVVLGKTQKAYGWSLKFVYTVIPSRNQSRL